MMLVATRLFTFPLDQQKNKTDKTEQEGL